MLTGRESLKRLIGKRRRNKFLPDPNHLLLKSLEGKNEATETLQLTNGSPIDSSSTVDGNEVNHDDVANVDCPVCGSKIRGDTTSVNSHLDLCLVRGTKRRKMSQQTLLQFSFSSQPKTKTFASEGVESRGNEFEVEIAPCSELIKNELFQLPNSGTDVVTYDCGQPDGVTSSELVPYRPSLNPVSITQNHAASVVEKTTTGEDVSNVIEVLPFAPESDSPNCDEAGALSVLSGTPLKTYIVGRKFGDGAEITLGARISLLRDPFNVKDPNAIKVVSADSDGSGFIGFLPRELAQHLSSLMDKYHLNFEGVISSAPENTHDVVPIEIMCLQQPSVEELTDDDLILKSLCEKVVRSTNSGNKHPPYLAKYQQNFCLIIEEALRGNLHLFSDDEKSLLDSFSSMSDDAQRLFVRLHARKGPWFRLSDLSYTEIQDCPRAVTELSDASYARCFSNENKVESDDLNELLKVLTVRELCDILRIVKKESNISLRKKELVASLHCLYMDGMCAHLPNLVFHRTGKCIRISSFAESLLWRVQRLFFLNGEQDPSAFLLADLGIVRYPEYRCATLEPIFCERSDLLAYEEAVGVAQILDQSFEDLHSELILQCIRIAESQIACSSQMKNQLIIPESGAAFLQCFSASWVYSKVVLLGVSYFEQERRYQDAIRLLKLLLNNFSSDGRRGYWMLRLSTDLEHIGCLEESLSTAEDGVLDPWVRAGSRMALQRRVIRLGKPPRRWKTPSYAFSVKRKTPEVLIQGRPLNCEVGTKNRFYGEDGEQCGVEQLALQYYAGEGGGWQGVHTESGIWLTIYGLIMWDIIFADVPNVFRTRFQNAPLDMDSENFYIARKSLIEHHLQKIREGMAETILIMSWESHLGTVCRGVNWEKHSLSELRAAVTCIGGTCLANMCRLLAEDYRSWSSGMPDLLLWRFSGDYSGEAKLVEVKGPKDRLSEQQRAWLLSLMDCGFTTEVCKVNPPSSS